MNQVPASVERYIAADKRLAAKYRSVSREKSTVAKDRQIWKIFSNFLGSRDPWKAGPDDIAAYCAHRADNGVTAKSIKSELTHLNFVFERLGKGHFTGDPGKGTLAKSPCKHPVVWQTMKGIRLLNPAKPKTHRPITLALLDALLDAQPDTLSGTRNKAFWALVWAGAMRVKEVIDMDTGPGLAGRGYIEINPNGLIMTLNRSKAHPAPAVPECYGIPNRSTAPRYCPVKLTKDWMRAAEVGPGPLFPAVCNDAKCDGRRTYRQHMTTQLKGSLSQLGCDPTQYGASSLRSGCIEWLLEQGVFPEKVKAHTGHTRLSTMYGYLRGSTSIETSPFNRTRWVD